MHKLCIILTKSEDKEDAISNVKSFLEDYGEGNVWDWYRIGGRWNNLLAPKNEVGEFEKIIKDKYPILKESSYSINDIENKETKEDIQNVWENLGLKGKNPYYNYYAFNIKTEAEEDGFYNVIPLSECIDIVRDKLQNLDELADEAFDKLVKEREEEKITGKGTMSAYYANTYKDFKYGDFSFELNVYDCYNNCAEQLPENISEYYAVVIDMHN